MAPKLSLSTRGAGPTHFSPPSGPCDLPSWLAGCGSLLLSLGKEHGSFASRAVKPSSLKDSRKKARGEVWGVSPFQHLSLVASCLFLIFSKARVVSLYLDRIKGSNLTESHLQHSRFTPSILEPFWHCGGRLWLKTVIPELLGRPSP